MNVTIQMEFSVEKSPIFLEKIFSSTKFKVILTANISLNTALLYT